MQINERIDLIKDYFKGFNIAKDTTTVLVKFPDTWKVFDEKHLNENYNVYTGVKDEGVYFITESSNGVDKLFDAVEYVIKVNKDIENKQILLQEKANELTALFLNEPYEKLKTLKFVMDSDNIEKSVVENKAVNIEDNKADTVEDKSESNSKKKSYKSTKKANSKSVKDESIIENKTNNDSDTMSFIKGLTGEDKQ